MNNILIVEDDKDLNYTISEYFKNNQYIVKSCHDGLEALQSIKDDNFDLIISDIMMPQMDGFSLVERIRENDTLTPIIFMTARDDRFSKQLGYKLGIDDYVVKPFDIEDLLMKVGAILRRSKINSNQKLIIGNLVLDKVEHSAYLDGKELAFTVREFDLLYKLLSYPKKTFTRSQLMEEFWDYDSSATSRTVDVYMAKIREKTNNCNAFKIVTVHGLGYKVIINEK